LQEKPMKDTERMLRPTPCWGEEVTLVPYSGLQMLDFGFDETAMNMRPRRFIERKEGGDKQVLHPVPEEERHDGEEDGANGLGSRDDDLEYSIRPAKALDPFLDKWLPAPVLRIRPGRGADGKEQYDDGPFGWARLRVTDLGRKDPATGHTHRVQLAFDTSLAQDAPGGRYLAPDPKDSEDEREFRFVSDPGHVTPFLTYQPEGTAIDTQKWVDIWLDEVFREYRQARSRRPLRDEDFPYSFEHLARYMTLLALLDHALEMPRIRLADVVSAHPRHAPFDVDLVLDIGNSRTCGILIESISRQTSVDLSNSYGLEVRDLSHPEYHSTGLIDSRVEFAAAEFGREHLARRSGRRNSFQWPSMARTGPEAARMVRQEAGTETASGISSPKRYLWDMEPAQNEWRFQNHLDMQNMPRALRSATPFLNDEGDVIEQVKEDVRNRLKRRGDSQTAMATRPRFSRSALFGFLVGELIAHARVQINDPAARARRANSAVPRRLRSVILTMPSATPVQEQAIIRSRAEGAIKLVWSILGMKEDSSAICKRPKLRVEWDEASCTQLVYLYSEIAHKFEGRMDEYMALRGRKRAMDEGGGALANSLRVACVDIGGGTTDLMVTTYFSEDDSLIQPRQVFREGFRIAGDDVIRDVIRRIVLERIGESIEAAGGSSMRARLRELFGGDLAGMDVRIKQKRRQFVLRVLAPLAVAALESCEHADEFDKLEISAAAVLGTRSDSEGVTELAVPADLLAYLQDSAAEAGAEGWQLVGFQLRFCRSDIDICVENVLGKALRDLGEAIDHLGVDVLLLTGRPSRLPKVRAMIREMMLVAPDRLISMHRYQVGQWYPFRNPVTNEISDPKTTVAAGGMLCALSNGRIVNFRLATDSLQMLSTARFVGVMDNDGRIPDKKVIFRDELQDEAELRLHNPVHVGFRQLPRERWTTTPLYRLDFADEKVTERGPLKVTLRRRESDADQSSQPEEVLRAEAAKEAFVVENVEDSAGHPCRKDDVRLRLHLLGAEDAYWLDTGICFEL